MSLIRLGSAAAALTLLTLGSVLSQNLLWLAASLLASLLLAVGARLQRRWTVSAWLMTVVLAAAVIQQPAALFLPAVLMALAHWDLQDFDARLSAAPQVFDRANLVRRHLAYLLAALALGGGLAAIALLGRVRLGFAPAAALVIVAVVGLRGLVRARS